MLDDDTTPDLDAGESEAPSSGSEAPAGQPAKRPAAKKPAAKKATSKKAPAKKPAKKSAPKSVVADADESAQESASGPASGDAQKPAPRKSTPKKAKKAAAAPESAAAGSGEALDEPSAGDAPAKPKRTRKKTETAPVASADGEAASPAIAAPLFQVPEPAPTRRTRGKRSAAPDQTESTAVDAEATAAADESPDESADEGAAASADEAESPDEPGTARRRRRRGGRRRRKSSDTEADDASAEDAQEASTAAGGDAADESGDDLTDESAPEGASRRRRRRRRAGEEGGSASDDPQNTVTRVRRTRSAEDEITAVSGSTRLEAKKQRRREGREAGRRRAPIVSEAEFLARRESVERVMVIRQRDELTQIAVLEDKVLVEHYVARESQTSLIGNVYLGRVQNVLPSMEAAFVDIGKGRNAVLYAGEVNWSALGHPEGQPRKIESVLSSGQQILVQVTKDPVGHKGARLTSQVSLAGRFLVYVPDGTTSGISRKLPDTERNRLKTLLKEIVPDSAGVIVRTAAEGASEEELTRDVERLKARWEDIEKKAGTKGASAQLLYGEPDLTLKVVRDLFTEDFSRLVIEGEDAWDTVQGYVAHVAPDLEPRLERYRAEEHDGRDVFAAYRIDEQIHKGLDRKVWLPSGGSLIIDRTEAMTVVDVNTGKFTGSGGNLEETVTKNNLEAAEEIVRQLRLRDIGGIIVVDFIDMVLESNRDLVLRRLVECLGRDRTRHQVAEVTSLGLVQMTRKRIGTGLLESFSHDCEACHGRGLIVEDAPVEARRTEDDSRRGRRGRSRGAGNGNGNAAPAPRPTTPSPRDVAAVAKPHPEAAPEVDEEAELADATILEHPVAELSAPEERHDAGLDPVAAETTEETTDGTSDGTSAAGTSDGAQPSPEVGDEREPNPADDAQEPVVEAPEQAPVAVEPPKVLTRTRRRAASRPAGPPAPAADVSDTPRAAEQPPGAVALAEAPSAEDGGADHEPAPAALHVPIKRRGSRKR